MSAFDKLNKSKQETIINAAIKEFAEKGYKDGSTNSIVKNAGISKGALFFYFKSKEALYLYVLEYCLNFRTEMILKCIDFSESDLCNRLSKYLNEESKIHLEYPYMSLFFEMLLKERPPCALGLIDSAQKMFADIYKYFSEGIDTSYLRDDISFEYIVKIIIYIFNGYNNDLANKSKMTVKTIDNEKIFKEHIEKIYKEIDELLEVFKKLFYKN